MKDGEAKYKLRNHMEEVVSKKLDEILPNVDMCKCEKCRMDVLAYALNLLSPKYVVTDTGDLYSRVSEFTVQSDADVAVALAEAIKVVSKNPKHAAE